MALSAAVPDSPNLEQNREVRGFGKWLVGFAKSKDSSIRSYRVRLKIARAVGEHVDKYARETSD